MGTVAGREFQFGQKEFQFLSKLIYNRSGIVLPGHKMDLIYGRLARRLRALGLATFRDYCALLHADESGQETAYMINAITTNLTRFFREEHHFEHLKEYVLKPFLEQVHRPGGARKLRIWSAGCSTGEEPYSIAMTIAEVLGVPVGHDIKVLATDLDTTVIEKGRQGSYRVSDLETLPKGLRRQFFVAGGSDTEVIVESVKSLVTFRQLNLVDPWPIKGPFDAIFCRNTMIYFDKPTKTSLVARFRDLLAPGGVLYVGHSESFTAPQSDLRSIGRTAYTRAA